MTSCSHVAWPPASRWWIVSVGRWRTWRKNLAGVVTLNRQSVSGTVEKGDRRDREMTGLEGAGTGAGGVGCGREMGNKQVKDEKNGRVRSRRSPGEDGAQLFSFTVGDPGSLSGGITCRTEPEQRQVKWSHCANKHGHQKNPHLIHWTYLCVYTISPLICWFALKVVFTGKRL